MDTQERITELRRSGQHWAEYEKNFHGWGAEEYKKKMRFWSAIRLRAADNLEKKLKS